jgi:hypothetical protein
VKLLYAEDLRDFKVGASIQLVPERGYVNLRCEDKTEIFKWSSFKKCEKKFRYQLIHNHI